MWTCLALMGSVVVLVLVVTSAMPRLMTFYIGLYLLPMWLEPTCLNGADGKCRDVITMVPWSNGRLLVWDATCADTFATSHLSMTAFEVCAAANQAEQTNIKNYSFITYHAYHFFTPVTFETTGVCGPHYIPFLTDLGRCIVNTTGDKSSLAYLLLFLKKEI